MHFEQALDWVTTGRSKSLSELLATHPSKVPIHRAQAVLERRVGFSERISTCCFRFSRRIPRPSGHHSPSKDFVFITACINYGAPSSSDCLWPKRDARLHVSMFRLRKQDPHDAQRPRPTSDGLLPFAFALACGCGVNRRPKAASGGLYARNGQRQGTTVIYDRWSLMMIQRGAGNSLCSEPWPPLWARRLMVGRNVLTQKP